MHLDFFINKANLDLSKAFGDIIEMLCEAKDAP